MSTTASGTRLGRTGRRRRDLPARRRPARRGGRRRTPPAARARTPTSSARSWSRDTDLPRSAGLADARPVSRWSSPAAPARSPGRPGAGRDARASRWPASRSRCATSTTSPATPAGWWPRSTPPAPRARSTTTCPCYVELPRRRAATAGWRAADEVAAAELRLKFRTGGARGRRLPRAAELAAWIDAALDRETPFKCTAGLHHAVRHTDPETGFEHHGFLNVLLATRRASTAPPRDDVVATLEERDAGALLATRRGAADLAGARRWFTSFGSCAVTEPARRPGRRSGCVDELERRDDRAPGSTAPPARSYDVDNLPYGVFSRRRRASPRVGVRIGDRVLDLAPVAAGEMLDVHHVFDARLAEPADGAGPPVLGVGARLAHRAAHRRDRARPRRAAPACRSTR